jgi:aryl-alcohol dehydrogenase-like predicted oxidoreductase
LVAQAFGSPEFFLGTMTFGENWGWGAPAGECKKMFEAYAEAGGCAIDTAINCTDGARSCCPPCRLPKQLALSFCRS